MDLPLFLIVCFVIVGCLDVRKALQLMEAGFREAGDRLLMRAVLIIIVCIFLWILVLITPFKWI